MPKPAAQPPTNLTQQIGWLAGKGRSIMPEEVANTFTLPSQIPPVTSSATSALSLVGADAVKFSFTLGTNGAGSATAVFPALPYRDNTQNPIAPQQLGVQQTFSILPIDLLILVAFVQNLVAPPGVQISVAPQAINSNGATVPGPFLGHDTYQTFGAVVSATSTLQSGTVSGFVAGLLLRSNG